ncbi:hypothetical protein FHX41_4128 [Actinomadura hallensis]|uniref:Uncharacterized protein n=1 Tax=Actinomadura hallensis TaxID=337895 RepID=A0A543IIJ3_9ACTN|nr:hypothetical protein [Actinomadura hallensis]TQM70404.1 hypothetical protein FHX41_4128 [Actinomadura hallensis]HLV73231.1 hypothetical protein [Vulgatibacteraceae bacterium]
MSTIPQGSALEELRAAYHEQLVRLAAERDAARRQARIAQAQADVARADLASLKSSVRHLLNLAARHLPDLEPVDPPAATELPGPKRALPAGPDAADGGTPPVQAA